MTPMVLAKRALTWFCMYQPEKSMSRVMKNIHLIFTLAMFLGDIQSIVTGSMFFWKNASFDLGGSLYAIFQVSDSMGACYAIPVGIFMRHKIRDLFESLLAIYKNCKIFMDTFYSITLVKLTIKLILVIMY